MFRLLTRITDIVFTLTIALVSAVATELIRKIFH